MKIETSIGSISVHDVAGAVTAIGGNGSITISGAKGVNAKTSVGGVTIDNVGGQVEAGSGNGSINFRSAQEGTRRLNSAPASDRLTFICTECHRKHRSRDVGQQRDDQRKAQTGVGHRRKEFKKIVLPEAVRRRRSTPGTEASRLRWIRREKATRRFRIAPLCGIKDRAPILHRWCVNRMANRRNKRAIRLSAHRLQGHERASADHVSRRSADSLSEPIRGAMRCARASLCEFLAHETRPSSSPLMGCCDSTVQKHLVEFPDRIPVTTEQDRILGAVFGLCGQLTARRYLAWVPSNRDLARKYSISPRTVTNWRREGAFGEGQARSSRLDGGTAIRAGGRSGEVRRAANDREEVLDLGPAPQMRSGDAGPASASRPSRSAVPGLTARSAVPVALNLHAGRGKVLFRAGCIAKRPWSGPRNARQAAWIQRRRG